MGEGKRGGVTGDIIKARANRSCRSPVSRSRVRMILVKFYDNKIHKRLLLTLGLWPGSCPKIQRLRQLIVYFVILAGTLSQLSLFFAPDCGFKGTVQIMSAVFPNLIAIVKYMNYHLSLGTVRTMFTEFEIDWEFLKDNAENIEIYREHARNVYISTLIIGMLGIFWTFVLLILLVLSLHDLPANFVRIHVFSYLGEHIDRQTYTDTVAFSTFVIWIVDIYIIIATEFSIFILLEHVNVCFKIVGRSLKYASEEDVLNDCVSEHTSRIRPRVCRAVRVHAMTIKFVDIIWDTFGTTYWIIIPLGIAGMSANMMNVVQGIKSKEHILVITSAVHIITLMFYAFAGTFCGQRLIDYSVSIFYDAYNSRWYEIPVDIQKLYLFILQRSLKCCSLSNKSIFVSSFEGLVVIISSSFSYFTLFLSLHK